MEPVVYEQNITWEETKLNVEGSTNNGIRNNLIF